MNSNPLYSRHMRAHAHKHEHNHEHTDTLTRVLMWHSISHENVPPWTFNTIAIQNYKFQMASGQGSHGLTENPTILSSMYSQPITDICPFYF